jgi:hypothetical protein
MSIFKYPGYRRTKFCFVYCGDGRCNCGINDPMCADSVLYTPPEPSRVEVVLERCDHNEMKCLCGGEDGTI